MKFYKKIRTLANVLAVASLTAIIPSTLLLSTSAGFQQAEALRFINVATEANATILGATTNQHLSGNGTAGNFGVNLTNMRAHAIATGDVNGDGIPDVVTGAPDATFTVNPAVGPPQTRTSAGIAYIVLGKSGLSGTIDTNAGQAEITILGAKTGDKLGFSLAIGDVNGDGIDDISIGAPGADFPGAVAPPPPARNDTGAVFVIFGSAALSNPHTIDLATANAANVALFGVNTGDQFGASVAVGNVGGLTAQTPAQQAVKDILVGAPGNNGPDGSSRPGAGAAYAQYGGSQLNPIGGATTVIDLVATPANVIVFGKTGDALGASVAIADINGGGIADIIAGAPLADRTAVALVPVATDTGAVFAIFGGTNLTPAVGTSKSFDINATQQNVSVYGSDDADHLGVSVATGDVTGDGTPDLLMGAPDADGPADARASAGEAYVLQGGAALNPAVGSEKRFDLLSGSATVTVFGNQAGDRFGSIVAAGSYNTTDNTDNTPDLIVGAPGANNRGGIVSIVFGGSNLLLVPVRDLSLSQDNLRIFGQSGVNNDLSSKQLSIRQTLTTGDQAVTPFLQQLLVSINGNPPVVNDDTQAQFNIGTLTKVIAASTPITGDTTALGDLELATSPALALDGTTGFMTVTNSASLKPGAGSWTVEFWIKRTGAGTGTFPQVIGSRPAVSSATDKGWAVALASGSSFKVAAHFGDGATGLVDEPTVQSTSVVPVDTWQHWAVVFDRAQNRVQFFKNGTLDVTQNVTFPTGAVDQTDPILIGKDSPGTSFLQANVDDLRVWNVARTAQQILDNFKNELAGTETGLAANWNFNAGNTDDLTANNNDGTLTGGATIVNPTDRHFLTGTRLSTFTFPAATTASTSSISWVQTTPAGTTVKIETSLDGATFQTNSNGSGIASITIGDELGWAIGTADINNNQGGELIIGAPFANAVTAAGTRTQAGIVYILPSTSAPPPTNQPPSVTLTAPNGGEILQVGQDFDIKWTASDPNGDATIQKFELRLSTDGGANFNFTIPATLAGTARMFTWKVPVGFSTTQGRIRVIVTDNGDLTAQDASNANFTITDVGVIATLVSPNGGESLRFGQQFTITWTIDPAVAALVKGFDLNLSTDSGLTFPIKIAPGGDPSQPALVSAARSFPWTVPSICTSTARVAVVTTTLSNQRTSIISAANFVISDVGPTIDTSSMFIQDDFRLFLLTTPPAVGSEVVFSDTTVVEVSSDASGTTFFTFSKSPKIKKAGRKYLSKGTINGVELGVFLPNGATRVIRITKPPCGITLFKVFRSGEQLLLAAADETDSQPIVQQRVWQ
ncbi:MAG: LamG-like jellyroll fold domain-containing protein [Acidobacteriota bacterium]